MVKVGTIAIDLVAYTGGLTKPLRHAERQVAGFGKSIRMHVGGALGGLQKAVSGTAAQVMGLAASLSAGGMAVQAMKMASAYEDVAMSFTTFLRSGEKAKALLADLQKFSDVTPFTAEQVQKAGRGLLAFGFTAQDIIPTLQYLGDAAAGSQQDIGELVDILGKIKSKGKLQLEELNRFTERGISLVPELAKQLAVSQQEVYKIVSSGTLGFSDVERALKGVTSAGGLFENAMVNLSQTTSGKLSTMKSAFANAMRDIGTVLIEGFDIKGIMDRITQQVDRYRVAIVSAVNTAVSAIVTGMGYVGQAMQWVQQNVHYFQVAWKGAQLGVQLFVTGAVDLAALLVQGFEIAVESIASAFQWLWHQVVGSAATAFAWVQQKVADFLMWLEAKLPEAMRTGLGQGDAAMAQSMRAVAERHNLALTSGDWKVNLNLGGDTSRAFADAMLDQARTGFHDLVDFANNPPQQMADMGKDMSESVARLSDVVAALTEPMAEAAETGTAIASPAELSVAAMERGSQEAFKAIMATRTVDIEKQSLAVEKEQLAELRNISRRGIALSPAGLA